MNPVDHPSSSLRVLDVQEDALHGFSNEKLHATLIVEGSLFHLRSDGGHSSEVAQSPERTMAIRHRLKQVFNKPILSGLGLWDRLRWDSVDHGYNGDTVYCGFLGLLAYQHVFLLLSLRREKGCFTRVGIGTMYHDNPEDFLPICRAGENFIDARPELFE